jgi:hypothetical protein
MGGSATRQGILVGLGFGVVMAILVVVLQGGCLLLLAGLLFSLGAGALAAYLAPPPAAAAPVNLPPGALGAPPPRPPNPRMNAAVAAGVVLGVLSALAFTVVAGLVVNSPGFRDQLQTALNAQGGASAGLSVDSLLPIATVCAGCIYLLIIPAITTALTALGGWIYGRVKPLPAAPPTWTPPPVPPMPGGPVG